VKPLEYFEQFFYQNGSFHGVGRGQHVQRERVASISQIYKHHVLLARRRHQPQHEPSQVTARVEQRQSSPLLQQLERHIRQERRFASARAARNGHVPGQAIISKVYRPSMQIVPQ
jgi:hypothetical protein